MQFNLNDFILKNLWVIIVAIFTAHGWLIKLALGIKQNKDDIDKVKSDLNDIKTKDLEAIKQFNDDRACKMESKIDRMSDKMDSIGNSVNHLTGYLMGLKDKEGQ